MRGCPIDQQCNLSFISLFAPCVYQRERRATVKDRYGEPERGSEWEPIKILLEGDRNSNKMNTASNTRLRLATQVGQAHVATGVPLDLGTNTHTLPT
jgi:hypothetical protein